MPYTTVVAGTTITASWSNTNNRDQVITPFASVSARDSAITSPVNGMYCTTTDTGGLWRYNGTKWLRQPVTLLKVGDTSYSSNAGSNNDDTIFFSADANATYQFDLTILWIGNTTNLIKHGITFPTGGRLDYSYLAKDTGGAMIAAVQQGVASGSFLQSGSTSSGAFGLTRLTGMFANGSTAGTFQLQSGQVNSGASASWNLRGTQMSYLQIA